jgi:hypothetical protein
VVARNQITDVRFGSLADIRTLRRPLSAPQAFQKKPRRTSAPGLRIGDNAGWLLPKKAAPYEYHKVLSATVASLHQALENSTQNTESYHDICSSRSDRSLITRCDTERRRCRRPCGDCAARALNLTGAIDRLDGNPVPLLGCRVSLCEEGRRPKSPTRGPHVLRIRRVDSVLSREEAQDGREFSGASPRPDCRR